MTNLESAAKATNQMSTQETLKQLASASTSSKHANAFVGQAMNLGNIRDLAEEEDQDEEQEDLVEKEDAEDGQSDGGRSAATAATKTVAKRSAGQTPGSGKKHKEGSLV